MLSDYWWMLKRVAKPLTKENQRDLLDIKNSHFKPENIYRLASED